MGKSMTDTKQGVGEAYVMPMCSVTKFHNNSHSLMALSRVPVGGTG